jgi:O-antigen/teichoic acid export membrane protein
MKEFLKRYNGEILYSSSNLFLPMIGFLANIIATAYIVPENMGIYQSVLIITTYTNFLHLGVFHGLNRNISYYKAQNRLDVVQNQVNTSNTVALFISLISSIIGAIVFFYVYLTGKGVFYILAAILLILNLVFVPIKTHMEATFRSSQEFGILGKITFKENIIYGVFSLLPIIIGYYGKIIADVVRSVISFYFRKKYYTLRSNGRGNIQGLIELIKVGFPILIASYLWSVFVIADQTYIAIKFSKFDLGVYTLSRLIITAMILIPNAVGAILYPKLSAAYGKTGKVSSLRIFWKISVALNGAIIIPVVGIIYFCLPYFVENFMPNYSQGLYSAKLNLLTSVTYVFMGPAVILGVLKRNTPYLIALAIILIIFWGSCSFLTQYFKTLNSVALFKLVLSVVLSIFIAAYTYYITSEKFDSCTSIKSY